MTTEPAVRDVLTQADAEARAAAISNVFYDLTLDLTKGAPRYRGDATIRFAYDGPSSAAGTSRSWLGSESDARRRGLVVRVLDVAPPEGVRAGRGRVPAVPLAVRQHEVLPGAEEPALAET